MIDIDKETIKTIAVPLAVLAAVFGLIFIGSYRHEPVRTDLTEAYAMPPELAGCRVYRLSPKGVGETLYIVTKDGDTKATAWDAGSGKHRHRVEVVTP